MKKILGLDLGTTSIGWAVVNEATNKEEKSSIVKLGVRVNPLTVDEQNALRDQINEHLVEGDLRREVNMNIKTKMEINSYQARPIAFVPKLQQKKSLLKNWLAFYL